jgi:hypothetical protein
MYGNTPEKLMRALPEDWDLLARMVRSGRNTMFRYRRGAGAVYTIAFSKHIDFMGDNLDANEYLVSILGHGSDTLRLAERSFSERELEALFVTERANRDDLVQTIHELFSELHKRM